MTKGPRRPSAEPSRLPHPPETCPWQGSLGQDTVRFVYVGDTLAQPSASVHSVGTRFNSSNLILREEFPKPYESPFPKYSVLFFLPVELRRGMDAKA